MSESVLLQSPVRRKTSSVSGTPEQNHSSPDRMDTNHLTVLTHTNGTTTVTPDFDILPPINTPKASDRLTWNNISESFATLHEVNPIYRQSDPPSIKLNKLNTFTYSFFKSEYGCKEPKQKLVKRKGKDPEKKRLRKLKRES